MDDENEWVPASAAVGILATKFGDLIAKETIISRLGDGLLSMRAQLAIKEADIGTPFLDAQFHREKKFFRSFEGQADQSWVVCAETDDELVDLPRNAFSRENGWRILPEESIWPRGIFCAKKTAKIRPKLKLKRRIVVPGPKREIRTIPANPELRLTTLGIHFHRDEINNIIGGSARSTLTLPKGDKGLGPLGRARIPSTDPADERPFPGDDAPVREDFQRMIAKGEFAKEFGEHDYRGKKAKIARAFADRLRDRDIPVPSDPTLLRRAGRLMDDQKSFARKMTRRDPNEPS